MKFALRSLVAFHPKLGQKTIKGFQSAIAFLSYMNKAHKIIELGGGAGDLKFFILRYASNLKKFQHRPLKHPVIVILDNDGAAKDVFNMIKKTYKITITPSSPELFFHIADNLYLVKTPLSAPRIEDLFDPSLLKTEIEGKKFNPDKEHEAVGEYGKAIFADKVVRPNADKIDFSKFAPLLESISAAMDHYKPPTTA